MFIGARVSVDCSGFGDKGAGYLTFALDACFLLLSCIIFHLKFCVLMVPYEVLNCFAVLMLVPL